jgi:hypothetical protein
VGVRILAPWLYGTILAVFATALLASSVFVGRRLGVIAPAPEGLDAAPRGLRMRRRDAAAGVASLTAYLLILFAYSIAPLATVAPLRESGIVLAAAWGSIRLGETSGNREAGGRVVAAGLVVVGAVLLAVSS